MVDAFLYDGLFVGVEFGVEVGTGGEGDGERFWMDVDLDNRDGGWANAGSDFRVDRARGDWDMATESLLLRKGKSKSQRTTRWNLT